MDIFNYQRRQTTVVHAGTLDIGGDNSIRLQSMTTTNTDDTEVSVAQSERIIKAGGELVRLTTQGRREAENLKNIKAGLLADGFDTPLVADVHFNANVADVAALYADKVRVNPGNYVDPARTFKKIDYTDEEYAAELKKIDDRFVPFLNICKQHHTAIRIGVNHGSLSDRIRNRYGDTPAGIVESCMEFLRICKREHFNDVVISIKSSNTVVMVQSVRLLVDAMNREDMHYPLHLGVTEAGEGEDGRIKSAVGIGALLADGIGDTVRVSLSEEPEEEIPVAKHLVDYLTKHAAHVLIPGTECKDFNYLSPQRRPTNAVGNIGGSNVPVVISSRINGAETASKSLSDAPKPDYLYVGEKLPERLENGQKYIVDFTAWKGAPNTFPIYPYNALPFIGMSNAKLKFLVLQFGAPTEEYIACLKIHPEVVVICMSNHQNRLGDQRALVHEIWEAGLKNPVIFAEMYNHKGDEGSEMRDEGLKDKKDEESEIKDKGCEMKDKNNTEEIKPLTSQFSPLTCLQIEAAADMGALMIDGLCDGLWLMNYGDISDSDIDSTAFGILQAARLRMIKTEYISCPGCGRTLYDLRSTIAKVKDATKDMKGLKIGIMGCIVNGPGEMADADYGYVGAGPKKISLYRGKTCVEHAIPEDEAVEHLLALIKADRNE